MDDRTYVEDVAPGTYLLDYQAIDTAQYVLALFGRGLDIYLYDCVPYGGDTGMSNPKVVVAHHDVAHGTLRTYVSGFVLSISLTLAAYFMVVHHVLSTWTLAIVIAVLALIQFMVQLVFFLHLGQDAKPRFKLGVFLFMLLVVLIVVGGSLWIMHNLNYRMMLTPKEINDYMNAQVGI